MMHQADAVIVGGAFSGAAAGLLLRRRRPSTRVLIIEKSEVFDRKVGESTSEVAGCFLTRVLGLNSYLAREHISKHGLRMWFCRDPESDTLESCSEIGAQYQVRLPTYQLDRSKLDAHLLDLARDAGCEVWRPAAVREVELGEESSTLTVKVGDEVREVCARWIIDASGKAAWLARKRGTWRRLDDHPTSAMWARFRNAADLDGFELRERFPMFAKAVISPRGGATNHLMGHGWWCWIIPLQNGDVSAGLTWDERIFRPPPGKSIAERLKAHLVSHPVGREIFGAAEPVERDVRTYSHLPYYSKEVLGRGWTIAGDAAGFMDPLYSQGLDYCAHTVATAVDRVARALDDGISEEEISRANREYMSSYFRWYEALYRRKYDYLGDAQLVYIAFLLDVGCYFIGPVQLVYRNTAKEFLELPYSGPIGGAFAAFMKLYNARLAAMARRRLATGRYGRANSGRRYIFKTGFAPTPMAAFKFIAKGTLLWIWCELGEAVRRPFARTRAADLAPKTETASSPVTSPKPG